MSDLEVPERKRSLPENPAVIKELTGKLSEDQKKVQVTLELSNGSTHPDIALTLFDAEGKQLAHTTILENFGPRLTFTMHTRQNPAKMPLRLVGEVNYLDGQIFSEKAITID
jgi:hypothetical protein